MTAGVDSAASSDLSTWESLDSSRCAYRLATPVRIRGHALCALFGLMASPDDSPLERFHHAANQLYSSDSAQECYEIDFESADGADS